MAGAAFSADGKSIVTASSDRTARIWSAATGTLLQICRVIQDREQCRFSPDGARVATASDDKTARIWSTQTGQSIVLTGHEDVVSDAEFSPNGRWIVTASRDHTARIWDSASGKLVLLLTDHTGADTAAAFSPDGDSIATSSADKTASIEKVALKNPFDKTQDLRRRQASHRSLPTIEQRAAAALDPEPPAWCIEMAKWPYATDQWKTWLAQKQPGHTTPLPDESLQ